MSGPFQQFTDSDTADLIRDHPLAWVRAADAVEGHDTLLPLLADRDGSGAVVALIGHMARRNPLFGALSDRPRASILFQGPHGYLSPSWVRDRRWAPTWAYARLRIAADVHFDPDATDAALAALVDAMEQDRPNRWHIAEMGPRYRKLAGAIVAFRAEIRGVDGCFKLGQDERPETLADILAHLPDRALAAWIRRFNPGRC